MKTEKKPILEMSKYEGQIIQVDLGQRQVTGTLVGHDPLANLVIDNAKDNLDRMLGLVVIRTTAISSISPVMEECGNPFE
jgi:small nuclear ribonucleoprotein (snRNP)-like protein